jgi:3-phosphoshikimate 1-carboxyvinyltransferase
VETGRDAEMTDAIGVSGMLPDGLHGDVRVDGDKSLSHRAILLAAIADGTSVIRGWLAGGDTLATLGAVRALGIRAELRADGTLVVEGGVFTQPERTLDLRHAGTGIRLLAGHLAGRGLTCTLDGSEQLRRRPMGRVLEPLARMGARIDSQDGRAPLQIHPATLRAIDYAMPVASAQVKSAVILAGLTASRRTVVTQPGPSRDHTERMLASMGATIVFDDHQVAISPLAAPLRPLHITVPGDFSSAAFLIVGATVVSGSEIVLRHINVNTTRTGLLDVLGAMGADIQWEAEAIEAGEPVADLRVRSAPLRGVRVGGDVVVRMIDEFPILMVAALRAVGRTHVTDAAELRVKETDRLRVMTTELQRMGAVIEETPDGFIVDGPQRLSGVTVASHDDHRIAMSLAIAGLLAVGETRIEEYACVADSFPRFFQVLESLGASTRTMNGDRPT